MKLPWLNDQETTFWARIAVPMGGPDRGTYVLPEIEDQVLVVFEHGDINRPIVIGSLWSKKQEPVEVNQSGKNNTKLIKSRCGHRIIFDDKEGAEKITIVDNTEKNKIVLDSVNKIVKIESDGDIEVKARASVILHSNALKVGTKESITGKGQSLLVHAQKTFGLKATSGITVGGGNTTINISNAAATSVSGSGAGELRGAAADTAKPQIEEHKHRAGHPERSSGTAPARSPPPGPTANAPSTGPEATDKAFGEIVEVCGFFGPNNVRRAEQQVRDAVVTRAGVEWTAWHTSTGAPRPESESGMFGRLLGYYLAGNGAMAPDTLAVMQATALEIDYGPFLAAGATSATAAAQLTLIKNQLFTGAPGATVAGLTARVNAALRQAREAHDGVGASRAWSAAFVSACVRGVAIALGLEAVIGTGTSRQHARRDQLLLATLAHATYTIEARQRRERRRCGTFHAFRPDERAPQLGDIVVQDRRGSITAAHVVTLAGLSGGETHGDIVVEVQPGFVVTIGGNVNDSVRKRRYPRDTTGMLIVDRQQLFAQEDASGTLPALPLTSTQSLASHSTARIFALLAPVEECAAMPGQRYGGGVLV